MATLYMPGMAGGPVTALDEDSVDRTEEKMGGWRGVKQPRAKGKAAQVEAAARIPSPGLLRWSHACAMKVLWFRCGFSQG